MYGSYYYDFILKSIQEWGFIVRKQQNLFLHVLNKELEK